MSSSGQGNWRGPEQRWPRHSKPWWRNAIDKARRAGWCLRLPGDSGHYWGKVYCRPPDEGDACSLVIFSTGEGSESVAKDLERMVDRCVHLSGTQTALLELAAVKMDKVESLISAADRLLEAAERDHSSTALWTRATELLDEAAERSDEINDLMEQAEDDHAKSRLALSDARAELRVLRLPTSTQPTGLIEDAERTSIEVKSDVKTLPKTNERVRNLSQRHSAAQAQLVELRRRLQFA